MGSGKDLVLVGGTATRRRMRQTRDWTRAKEARFLSALGDTCNVTLAAKIAGVGNTTVYSHRAKDAAFRKGWDAAIAQGFARLELEMLERALNGSAREIKVGGETQVVVDYPDRIGLALLKMHRDRAEAPERTARAEAEASAEEVQELRAKILAKLERVRERVLAREAGE